MNDHQGQTDELVGAYVLDALEPEERELFEAHLQICSSCRAEVAELTEVTGVLPLTLEPVDPPETLRGRLLWAIRDAEEPKEPAPAGKLVPSRRTFDPGAWIRRPIFPLAVAAAVVIAALGGWNIALQQQSHPQPTAYADVIARAIADHATVSPVGGTKQDPAATAAVVQPRGNQPGYLVVKGLASPPSNRVYQLWLIRTGAPTSGKVFTVSSSGVQIIPLDRSAIGFKQTAVTIEPGPDGSSGPTGPAVLTGNLAA